jgi:hypothetical protein
MVTLFCETKDKTGFNIVFPAKDQKQMDAWLKKNFGQKIKQMIEIGADRRFKISKITKNK